MDLNFLLKIAAGHMAFLIDFLIQDTQVSRRTASWQQAVTRHSKNWFYRQCHDIVHHDHADIDIKESDLIKIIMSRDFLK